MICMILIKLQIHNINGLKSNPFLNSSYIKIFLIKFVPSYFSPKSKFYGNLLWVFPLFNFLIKFFFKISTFDFVMSYLSSRGFFFFLSCEIFCCCDLLILSKLCLLNLIKVEVNSRSYNFSSLIYRNVSSSVYSIFI